MNENLNELEQLEISIQEAKKAVERKEALNRLENNADFNLLISDGFLKNHAVRQVLLKSHPGLQQEENQKLIDNQIISIGGLKQYFVGIFAEGNNAASAIIDDEKTQEELRQEGSE